VALVEISRNEQRARGSTPARRPRTLLVDDDAAWRARVAESLAAQGEVVAAESLEAAQAALAESASSFDAVVVGCVRPGDAVQHARLVEFVRALFHDTPALSVIVATSRDDAARLRADLLVTGLRDVLEAPVEAAAVMAALQRVARMHPRRRRQSARSIAAIQRVLAILEESRTVPTLTELARVAGMSPWHLSRTFHAVVGMSLRHYARDLRLKRGHALFVTGRRSITAIATEAGFYDLPHFVRTVRSRLGISPRAYRARYAVPVVGRAASPPPTNHRGSTVVDVTPSSAA
jgi:AraC-like DNA-binding protein